MSTKFKTGDKVKVMHGIIDPANKQGKKGELVFINEEEGTGIVKFKDGSEFWYGLSCLEKVKKKKKSVTPEVGKCYMNKINKYAIKVTEFDEVENPIGIIVQCFENYINTGFDMPLHIYFRSPFSLGMNEIPEEEFEQKLQEARQEMTRIYKQLKLESDEKANTKGTEMA